MRRKFKREGTYVYLWLIHVDVWQKPKQYYKAIILQLRINNNNKKKLCPPSSLADCVYQGLLTRQVSSQLLGIDPPTPGQRRVSVL